MENKSTCPHCGQPYDEQEAMIWRENARMDAEADFEAERDDTLENRGGVK